MEGFQNGLNAFKKITYCFGDKMVKGELKFSVRFLTFDDDTIGGHVLFTLHIGHQQKPKKDRRHKFFSGFSVKSFHILEYAFI